MFDKMFGSYDAPEFTEGDEDYAYCNSRTECMVLRMLKVYTHIVYQRYSDTVPLKRTSMKPGTKNFRASSHYAAFETLADALHSQGHDDPEAFVAFVFERWIRVTGGHDTYHNADLTWKGGKIDGGREAGFAYPSLTHFHKDGPALLEEYWAGIKRGWKPSEYILIGTEKERSRHFASERLDKKVERWTHVEATRLGIEGVVPEEEFWTNPNNWYFYSRPTAEALRYSESLLRCANAIVPDLIELELDKPEDIREAIAVAFEEGLIAYNKTVDRMCQERQAARDRGETVDYENLIWMDPHYEFCTEIERARIFAFQDAINGGDDPMDEKVQQKIENKVNPIDKEHSDTLTYFIYGEGLPRRLDGTEVSKEELEEMRSGTTG